MNLARLGLTLIIVLVAATHVSANSQILAGTGNPGFSGDGGHISTVQLNVPSDVYVTSSGDFYIVDAANNRIRRISHDGSTSTVVGNGQRIYSNDNISANQTGIMSPTSVVVDGNGAIYYSEWSGHRIRKVDTSGNVTTIAGNGESGYVGEGLAATETSLWTPSRIFLDGKGNLFIAEWEANRIRKVDASGTITTVAGNGERKFSGDGGPATEASLDRPNGLFVTKKGVVYFSDLGNNRIRRVTQNGVIETVAGNGKAKFAGDGGPATDASLKAPTGIFVDDGGNLFICDSRNHKIRKVDPSGTISTLPISIQATGAEGTPDRIRLRSPSSVFIDSKGDLYLADGSRHLVIQSTGMGAPTRLPVSAVGVTGYGPGGFLDGIISTFRNLF
jgi:sugar lactone lactonase YvrE